MKPSIALAALVALPLATSALADTSGKKVALSNNYAGNSWRQAMLQSWDKVGKQAVADKTIAAADPFTTADKEAPTQAAQIQNLILQGYDAIVVDAASPEALNGAVKQACDAGIVVVAFDGLVTEPCAYKVTVDLAETYGAEQVRQVAKRLPGGGNLLYVRGLAGTSIDDDITRGVMAEIAKHPNLKIVSSVNGNWDQTTAQKAVATVLPSLPEIAGVIDQGGDGYGTAQAFKAAGRTLPLIMLGNRQDELAWWKEQRAAPGGYDTWSASEAPGMVTFAFWVAQQVLDGKEVPKQVPMGILTIDSAELDKYLAGTPVGGVANVEYSQAEVIKAIAAAK
ncbi:ABC transporter substrate-binding protein [Labrys wisconsinensis]|uniref:Ribose transport system substrate-binding protein n=1 Tax=Labrys wisconsinensis TaxID=425677 RepID=A0ABU0J0G9_9HYPH|nr:ABC transporter substrate-binding protein [Labrys wisconsinensis]MDQ0467748.1 ribose transport system substrate-binding protein [Labrys wisconsinensis]